MPRRRRLDLEVAHWGCGYGTWYPRRLGSLRDADFDRFAMWHQVDAPHSEVARAHFALCALCGNKVDLHSGIVVSPTALDWFRGLSDCHIGDAIGTRAGRRERDRDAREVRDQAQRDSMQRDPVVGHWEMQDVAHGRRWSRARGPVRKSEADGWTTEEQIARGFRPLDARLYPEAAAAAQQGDLAARDGYRLPDRASLEAARRDAAKEVAREERLARAEVIAAIEPLAAQDETLTAQQVRARIIGAEDWLGEAIIILSELTMHDDQPHVMDRVIELLQARRTGLRPDTVQFLDEVTRIRDEADAYVPPRSPTVWDLISADDDVLDDQGVG